MYLGCAAWIDGFQRRFEFHLICELHGLSCRLMNIVNEEGSLSRGRICIDWLHIYMRIIRKINKFDQRVNSIVEYNSIRLKEPRIFPDKVSRQSIPTTLRLIKTIFVYYLPILFNTN